MSFTYALLKMRTICENVLGVPFSLEVYTTKPQEKEAVVQYLDWVNPGTVLDLFKIIKNQDARIRGFERLLTEIEESDGDIEWKKLRRLLRKKGRTHVGTKSI